MSSLDQLDESAPGNASTRHIEPMERAIRSKLILILVPIARELNNHELQHKRLTRWASRSATTSHLMAR